LIITMLIAFVLFYLVAYLIGSWADVILAAMHAKPSAAFRVSFGGCTLILAGMISSIACGMCGSSVISCVAVTAVLIVVAFVSGMVVKNHAGAGRGRLFAEGFDRTELICGIVAVLVVAVQIYGTMSASYEGTEAIRPVAAATSVFEKGNLFIADPMMLFIGTISRIVGIHPLRFIFSVAPVIFIPLYYLCSFEVISIFCSGTKRLAVFIAVALLNIWGFQSKALVPLTLLIAWFTTGVYIVHGLLNVAAILLIRYYQGHPGTITKSNKYEEDDDLPEEWDMNKHKIINARNLAIALGVLAVALIAIVFVLNSKINRLYDVTVRLQEDIESRCSVYEYISDDGEVSGYLLKGSDGNISFIGGGSSENASTLGEFIARYTDTVDVWYVYGDGEEESGAMKELVGSGKIEAGKVFVVNREELTGIQ